MGVVVNVINIFVKILDDVAKRLRKVQATSDYDAWLIEAKLKLGKSWDL